VANSNFRVRTQILILSLSLAVLSCTHLKPTPPVGSLQFTHLPALASTLEPCGCFAVPKGGKEAIHRTLQRPEVNSASVLFSVGATFYCVPNNLRECTANTDSRASQVGDFLSEMDLKVVHTPSLIDFTFSPEVFRKLGKNVEIVLTNLKPKGPAWEGIWKRSQSFQENGLNYQVLGLVDCKSPLLSKKLEGMECISPEEALKEIGFKPEASDFLFVLTDIPKSKFPSKAFNFSASTVVLSGEFQDSFSDLQSVTPTVSWITQQPLGNELGWIQIDKKGVGGPLVFEGYGFYRNFASDSKTGVFQFPKDHLFLTHESLSVY